MGLLNTAEAVGERLEEKDIEEDTPLDTVEDESDEDEAKAGGNEGDESQLRKNGGLNAINKRDHSTGAKNHSKQDTPHDAIMAKGFLVNCGFCYPVLGF
jgi:hypothetical protein